MTENIRDPYEEGTAPEMWGILVGDENLRTNNYKNFLVSLLQMKGCRRILDAACGTGIDSILLLEEGFEVVSVDASDKMLKYALQKRWDRRKEPAFDRWVIEEANWLTLYNDIQHLVGDGFDAVICIGNSFAHILDAYGDQREQRRALQNFEKCVRPGGLFVIDHRNYNLMLDTGRTPDKCFYYNSNQPVQIKTSILYESGKPTVVILDYKLELVATNGNAHKKIKKNDVKKFTFKFYPHRMEVFQDMLREAFGNSATFQVFGDYKKLEEVEIPGFYVHVVEKSGEFKPSVY